MRPSTDHRDNRLYPRKLRCKEQHIQPQCLVEAVVKRIFDIFVASVALVVLAPIIAIVALLVRSKLGKPILFRQQRPGRNGQAFEMVKFRTMLDAVDRDGKPLPDSDRLTPFGRLLRSTSLDELPELFNVLRGDMSLVGPRPLLMQYLPLYSAEQARRHEVRPGLTGWAQINGRNAVDWQEKFLMDVWYVDNQTFLLDLKIILLTMRKVAFRENISAEGEATMLPFLGNNR
jgi:lipopolysaccharide/colanic/teichoic acid biosynthesis glycosyltransferase